MQTRTGRLSNSNHEPDRESSIARYTRRTDCSTLLVLPVSPLRVDFDGDFLHKPSGFGLASARSYDATLRVPNLEHRLRLFITNDSLQETPVVDPAQEQNPVRAGLRWCASPARRSTDCSTHAYYVASVIPGVLYAGNPDDVPTISALAVLVTSNDQPDELAYGIVKAVFKKLADFRRLHPALSNWTSRTWCPLRPSYRSIQER